MRRAFPTLRGVRKTIAILLIIIAFGKVRAQTNTPTNTLALADAKQIAFEQNWGLLAAKSGVDAAEAQLIMAKEFPNPTVSLSTYKIGNQEAGTPLGNGLWERNYDSYVAVSQFFEIAGKRHDRQLAARAGVLSAKARFFDAKRTSGPGRHQGLCRGFAGRRK